MIGDLIIIGTDSTAIGILIIGRLVAWWDAGKRMLVRNYLIPMGKEMKRRQNEDKSRIEEELKEGHRKTTKNAGRILELKQRLRDIEEEKMRGAAVRSRTEWQRKMKNQQSFSSV